MATSIALFLLFAVLFANQVIAERNYPTNIIRLGSCLSPKSNYTLWASTSGHFAFGFYPQGVGFAVGIWLGHEPDKTIVWTAYRNSPPVSSESVIELTKDGLVLLPNETGKRKLITNTSLEVPADSASMLDSGNFVIYDKNHSVIWQSFDLPTDTILGGQTLSSEQYLVSALSESDRSSGNLILIMQNDGNLVAYPVNNRRIDDAYYATQTFSPNYVSLTLNLTGFLCLVYSSNNFTIRVLGHSNILGHNTSLVYRATFDVDGIFRLYVHRFEGNTNSTVHIVWHSLSDQCDVRGFCGYNSYCSSVAGKGVCHCYSGFTPINGSESMFLDCQRTSKDDCKTNEYSRMLYNLDPLPGLQLKNIVPYWVEGMTMEACRQSCQEDCDCGGVLYVRGNCNKYKLPIRFGRIKQNSSTMVFIKSTSGKVIISNPEKEKPAIHVDEKKDLIFTLVFTLGSISFLCLAFATSIIFIYTRKVHSYAKLSASSESLGFAEDCSVRTFAYNELVNATGNFTEEIGRGSFGVVYKGTIQGNNRRIAVKKLDNVVGEGEREFRAEITAIAQTHHMNLVQLIGYCIDGSRKLLVYEYMSNGSLADFLFKAEMHLSWKQRVKIALDVARGVLYLHIECEVCIVHCNIKPHNILLDEMWTAKISDFGLARLSIPEHSRIGTRNELASGYVAPERLKDASTSIKVDVYSYGVVLLEIICCRRNIDVNVASEEEMMLSSWVYNCFVRGELNKLVVDEDVEWRTLERMVKVALWCVQEDLSLRPSMKNVILMLEGLKDIPIPPSPIPLA